MLPEFDKNAAFIWACYGLGALMICATLITVLLKARAAKAGLARIERQSRKQDEQA